MGNNTRVSQRTISVHQEHEMLIKLESAGLTGDLAQRIIDSPNNNLARKVVGFIQTGGFERSVSQQYARRIMRQNYFGIEEAIRHFGIRPEEWQVAVLEDVPFSEETLIAHKDTHILCAVFPISFTEIIEKVGDRVSVVEDDMNTGWADESLLDPDSAFSAPRWRLVRKMPVLGSVGKSWSDQQELLSPDEAVPRAHTVIYTILGYYLETGQRLLSAVSVRCVDYDDISERRVAVGYFDLICEMRGTAFHVECERDHADDGVGLASVIRPPQEHLY
jgi:hypothetical protein